ncbi:hypothetical protein D8674_029930 [Pyrus ussuriensis x Pyrus communis]|uniref:Uncharacterized protein n=1 Tax=Pyrus ussuriensis x Pyrus communis TaxID=2448454 RepID=A0A5N5I3H3_9ROSA|nr:hypothetical protein D8674_029930 [Pyrus ussuriensis x Pyrus communis]
MARHLHTSEYSDSDSSMRLKSKARMVASVSAFLAIARRLSGKLKAANSNMIKNNHQSKVAPNKSPMMRKPKQLMSTISNKAITFLHRKKIGEESDSRGRLHAEEEEEWGDGGVWQRSILMGDKCEPLAFSGVIYYDIDGKKLNGAPIRSPRASPMPGYLERGKRN